MTHFHLFVYGTLQSGAGANQLLAGASRVGTGSVGGVLYDIDGEYPALILYGNSPVEGKVWHCPAPLLKTLDAYERTVTGLFRRVGVEVRASDGSMIPGWTYVAGPSLAARLTPARRVEAWKVTARR